MRRRFVAMNHSRNKIVILGFIILGGLIILIVISKWLFRLSLNSLYTEDKQINLLNFGTSNVKVLDLNLLDPNDILSVSLNFKKDNETRLEIVKKDEADFNPLVYIYNTHDDEKYEFDSVKYASDKLKSELTTYGIQVYVENASISDYLTTNDIKKSNAFEASRHFIDERWKEFEALKFFIDIHISNASREVTSAKIDANSYAKVLFIVNMENKFYERTLEFATTINDMLDKRISRGIMKKSDTNNYYNQDMDANCLLIELGGIDSAKEEVDNTMRILGSILFEYMSEGYNGN